MWVVWVWVSDRFYFLLSKIQLWRGWRRRPAASPHLLISLNFITKLSWDSNIWFLRSLVGQHQHSATGIDHFCRNMIFVIFDISADVSPVCLWFIGPNHPRDANLLTETHFNILINIPIFYQEYVLVSTKLYPLNNVHLSNWNIYYCYYYME